MAQMVGLDPAIKSIRSGKRVFQMARPKKANAAEMRTNLKAAFPRTRKPPEVGDIFVWQIMEGRFHFGRVIVKDPPIALGLPGEMILYFYKPSSADPGEIPVLKLSDLLIAPVMFGTFGWKNGFFRTVASRPLLPEDRLEVHCFEDSFIHIFQDENRKRLPGPVGPYREAGFPSFPLLDSWLSESLGIEPIK